MTGKSVTDSSIGDSDLKMNKILGMNNENSIDTLLSKKYFHSKLLNC